MKLKIKHKSYEVICPVNGKKLFVRALNIAEQNILASPVTSYVSGLNILLNVLFDTIQNPEVFKRDSAPDEDLYTSFLKQMYWDDLVAVSIGVLSLMSKEGQTLDLNIICQNTEAPELNENGICGAKYTASFDFNNLISDIKINEEQKPIYEEKYVTEYPEYGVKITTETPNLYKEMMILDLIERLKNSTKVFKKLNISDYHKDAILGVLVTANTITRIESLENPKEFVEFTFPPESDEKVIEFGQTLTEFNQLDQFLENINPDNFMIESIGEAKCPKCKAKTSLDLKEWIINTFLPDIVE